MKKIFLGVLAFLLIPVLSWAITLTADIHKVDGTIVFEGATYDNFDTTLAVVDPTANNTITFPNASGIVSLSGGVWTGLTDTPGTIPAGLVIQGNAGGTALESGQDLRTTANPTFVQVTVGNTGLVIGTSAPFSDAAGVLTLQNVDALDTITESTVETAIDTLANLTSVQGQTLTMTGSLNVSGTSLINQNVTTTGNPTFVNLTATGQLTSTKSGGGGDAGIHVISTTPAWSLRETDAAVDAKQWNIAANVGQFRMEVVNDANTVFVNFMTVDRTGTVIDTVSFPNGVVQIANALDMTAGLINNVLDPVSAQDAATKNYVDTSNVQGFVDTTGVPANDQVAIFTDANTIEGVIGLIFNSGNLTSTGQLISTKSGGGSDAGIHSIAPTPAWSLRETDAALDEKQWNIAANTGQLRMEAVNDANNVFVNFMTVDRTGTVIDLVAFPNGNVSVSNSLVMGNEILMSAHLIKNVLDPVSAQDAATKNYVDTHSTNAIWTKSGSNITTTVLTDNVGIGGTPISRLHIIGGLAARQMVIESLITDEDVGFALKQGGWEIRFRTNPLAGWFEITSSTGTIQHRWNEDDYMLSSAGILYWSSESNFATAGVGAADTNLFRGGANLLRTNDSLTVDINLTVGGVLDMTAGLINNVLDPVAAQDAATKNYVDTQAGNVSTSDVLTNLTALVGAGTTTLQAAEGAGLGKISASVDFQEFMVQAKTGGAGVSAFRLFDSAGAVVLSLFHTEPTNLAEIFAVNQFFIRSTSTIDLVATGNITINPTTSIIDVSTSKIINLVDPTAAQDAATKNYVDTQGFVDTNGTPANNQITVFADADTVEGSADLTYSGNASGILSLGKSTVGGFGKMLIQAFLVPTLEMVEGDVAADEKRWNFTIDSGNLDFNVLTDAGAATTYLRVNRGAGATITDIAFTTPLLSISGSLDMTSGLINNVLDPVSAQDAATKNYVDTGAGHVTTSAALTDNFLIRGNGGSDINIGSVTMSADGDDLFAKMFVSSEIGTGSNAGLQVTSIEPSISLNETNAAVDNRRWNFNIDDETLRFELVNDASSSFTSWLNVDRTGNTVDSVVFPNGPVQITNDLAVDTDTLIVESSTDKVKIGNVATGLTDLTIFQGSNNLKGLTLSGTGVTASSTTDGLSLFSGHVQSGNMQLWIGQKSDQGNSAKNSFRFIVGIDVPLIVGVNNIGTLNRSLLFGTNALGAGIGVGFAFTAAQADILAKLHIQTGNVAEIGFMLEAVPSQTADMLQIKDRVGSITAVIDKDANWGIGIIGPVGRLHVRNSGPSAIASLIVEGNGTSDVIQIRNSSSVVTSAINNIDHWGIGAPVPLGKLHVALDTISHIGLIIQAASGQTANLLEIRNSGGTVTSVLTSAEFFGLGLNNPSIKFHVKSVAGDVAVARFENAGTNPGSVSFHAGDRDPSGVVSSGDGAMYHKSTNRTSGVFENRSNLVGTDWFKHAVNPINTIEIVQADEFDALASGGIVTISVNTTLHIKGAITTSNRIVVNSGITLHITATFFGSKSFVYTGTGDFITTNGGTIRILGGPSIVSASTGTFMNFSGTGTLSITDLGIVGWDNLGTFNDGNFVQRNVAYINCDSGWTITDPLAIIVNIASQFGTTMNDSFFTVNTKLIASGITFNTVSAQTLAATGAALFNLNGRISNTASINISNSLVAVNKLFLQSVLSDATINSIVDSSPAAGTITQFADDVTGISTTVFSTTTYFEDEEVTQTGTTSYNGTFQIFGVVAGVSYKIRRAFVADDATGSIASVRIAMTLAAGHGITTGNSIKINQTEFYNEFEIALNIATNVLTVNALFIATDTGIIKRELSLDETDRRVNARFNAGFRSSEEIAFGSLNGNVTETSITDGTYVPIDVSNIVINQITECFRLISTTRFKWKYICPEPFNGTFEGAITALKSGSTGVYKLAMSTNGAVPIFATAPNIPIEVKTTKLTYPLNFSAVLIENDEIELMFAGNGTSDNLTATDIIAKVR